MQIEPFRFTGARGQAVQGRLHLPADREPTTYALFAHCFSCAENLQAANHISEALTQEGFGVLRLDFTGLQDGEPVPDYRTSLDDLVAAADALAEAREAPAILLGHSLAGAAVLQAAARIPSARAVATLAAPADPRYVLALLEADLTPGTRLGAIGGRKFCIDRDFLAGLEDAQMQQTLHNLRRPLLILHSPLDYVIGIDNASEIFTAAMHPKSFVTLDKADHLLSDPADACYAGRIIAAWARKYVESGKEAAAETAGEDNRVIAHTGETGFYTEILANGHPLIADEPVRVGGSNRGPSPYELVAAGLAACTSMTLRMYADRKGWPLTGVTTRVAHRKEYARDQEELEDPGGKVDVFERELELGGELEPEQRQRLLEIADRCPVHRSLHSEIQVRTQLK